MIKKSSDLKKINTNLNLQHLPQWPTGGARIFKEKWARAGNREQIGWKFGIGKEKMQLKFGKVKNKKNKKLLCMLTWTQKGYFEQLFEK